MCVRRANISPRVSRTPAAITAPADPATPTARWAADARALGEQADDARETFAEDES